MLPGYTSNAQTPILGMITADVNGDGNKDLVCSERRGAAGQRQGTFTAVARRRFRIRRRTRAGLAWGWRAATLITTGSWTWWWIRGDHYDVSGQWDGTFTAGASYASINNSGYVTVTDLDGDGNLDIYTGLANGGMFSGDDTLNAGAYVLMGHGDGTFAGAAQATGGYNGTQPGRCEWGWDSGHHHAVASGSFTVQLGNGNGGSRRRRRSRRRRALC